MNNNVNYTVSATDEISGKLRGMNSEAKGLEGTIGGLTSMLSTLGIAFGVFKGMEFVKEGLEKFHQIEQATAKIEANLESTSNKAGLAMKDIQGYAKELSDGIQASRADVLDMASQLLTFPAITKDVFQSSMGLIADIAKQTNHGLSETAIMYGKALSDPVDGLMKMQRYGVMFSETEKEKITKLQESGHLIQAQKLMMDSIAHSGYAGVAKAMFDADPLAQFNKKMENLQISVGRVAMQFLTKLAPTLNKIADWFAILGHTLKETYHWFEKHKTITDTLVVFLKSLVTGLILYVTWQKISAMWTAITSASMVVQAFQTGVMAAALGGASTAGSVWAGVMAVINAVMSANPVSLIIIGIAALVAVVYEAIKHFRTWGAAVLAMMGPFGRVINALKSIYDHWQSIKNAFTTGGIIAGIKRIGAVLLDSMLIPLKEFLNLVAKIPGMGNLAKGGIAEIDAIRKKLSLTEADPHAVIKGSDTPKPKPTTNPFGLLGQMKSADSGGDGKIKSSKGVHENKAVTINVTIGSLINDFKIQTTNIQGGVNDMKDMVAKALMGAVNDSQLIAGN
jgi:hypothetical protein